ncbi:MAG: hypothetical protein AB7F75_12080 [Planctomycetota bacterium]
MIRSLLILVLALLPLSAEEAPKGWIFNYKEGKVYTFNLDTSAEHISQFMTASSGYNGRGKDENHFFFNLLGSFDITITKSSPKGAEGLLKFKDLSLGAGFRVDEQLETNGSLPSKTNKGTLKMVTEDAPSADKSSYKVILGTDGGLTIKDKIDLSKCVTNMGAIEALHPELGRRAAFVFTEKFWARYLNCHFIPVSSKLKIPSGSLLETQTGGESKKGADAKLKQNMALELFLDPCNSLTCAYASGKLDIGFESLTDKEDGSCELLWKFRGAYIEEAAFCRSQVVTEMVKMLSIRSSEGYLERAPYELQLWNYSGDASKGIDHNFKIISLISCTNVADAPAK